MTAEREIRTLFEDWARAVAARDLEGVLAHCAPGLVWFDPLLQVQYRGLAAYRRHWQASLAEAGGLSAGIERLDTAASGDVAFCRALVRFERGRDDPAPARLHLTACLRRRGGRWLAVQEHFALPAEPEAAEGVPARRLRPCAERRRETLTLFTDSEAS